MNRLIHKYRRHLAFFFLINFVTQVFFPTVSFALTSGPTQPEVQAFKPIDVADMVNSFTGDLSYNVPLLDVDGYPVNVSYGGGSGMDQEATCVGLGWNINTGSISRSLRGIPDDFNGDQVEKEFNIKDNETYGVTLGVGGELFGTDAVNANYSIGVTFNNYTGYNVTQKLGISVSIPNSGVGVGLGVGSSSSDGLTLSPNISLTAKSKESDGNSVSGTVSLGTSFNSRTGMKELSLSVGVSVSSKGEDRDKSTNKINKDETNSTPGASRSLFNNSSSIGFGSPTWVPQITMPMKSLNVVGSFKLGGTLFGVDVFADITGNYSKQSLATKQVSNPAYGYLNLQNGQGSDEAMLDFNREKDASFTEATTNLPIPNLTYDNYSVMGQGVGGSYRPYRSDFGYVFDARATQTSESDNLSLEVALAQVAHAGIDFVNTTVEGSSGKWTDENNAINVTQFRGSGFKGYEPAYFKEQGEMNIDDDNLYTALRESKAMRFDIEDKGESVGLKASLTDENSGHFTIPTSARSERAKRNQHWTSLTINEASKFGLQTSLYSSVSSSAKGHHIGEITTTKTDGTRYVYGLPVYNSLQEEATFNVTGNPNATNNLVAYVPGTDNSTGNPNGIDNFYTCTKTPGYSYGHMLTAVLSADYIDRLADGPTEDDLGTYTLFNYGSSDKVSNYKWRTPFPSTGGSALANYDEGLLTDKTDGKGSYVYGEKELQYLSSIQTKNYIAIFEYSDRKDGLGVSTRDGGIGSTAQKKLDQITLYSKADYDLNGTSAFIIKQVHFKYDYSLCPNTYNNNGGTDVTGADNTLKGKLTLKQIYFTYGNSFKGKLSPYKFNYNTQVTTGGGSPTTPSYQPGSVDRWGTYKPNTTSLPNSKYPYTDQVKADADSYAALWNLKSIQLPSGGLINIGIEADDYAYVQDKRAGEMFKILGASDTDAFPSSSIDYLFDPSSSSSGGGAHNYLFFELKQPGIPINEYFRDVDKLYFRFLVKVNQESNGDAFPVNAGYQGYEFVNGYCEIDGKGICSNNSNYGYVHVKAVKGDNFGVLATGHQENPISKAAWQFGRLKTPRKAFTEPDPNGSGTEGIIRALANSSFLQNTINFFKGPNGELKSNHLGERFVPSKSWVRLSNPDLKKIGGGYRVKSVIISDKWNAMLSSNPALVGQTSDYGQNYYYDTNGNGTGTSAGVAAYEPSMGADENPFRQPIFMEEHKEQALLAPDNGLFIEAPLGESFFPSPTVGYSKVTVQSIHSGSGKTVSEFYTAKDFPTQVHSIGIDGLRVKPNPILQLFSFSGYDKFTGSQGYVVEVNDMHGKQKATHNYEEGALTPTESSFFHYKSSGQNLVNEVPAMTKNGAINHHKRIGIEYDIYADFRESNSTTDAIGIQGQLYFFMIGVFPALIPPILPTSHHEEIQLRTAVTNKVIYHYGIIDRVDNIHNSNLSSISNLLWDGETGEVLLTSNTTEFKDPIYSMKYPAHWSYAQAGGAYVNTGIDVPTTAIGSGGVILPPYTSLVTPGDELQCTSCSTVQKYWVYKSSTSQLFFMDKTGTIATSLPGSLKIVRSGHRNLQTLNVGATTTFTNPIYNTPSSFPVLNQNYGVLNATAIQMGDAWQTFCHCDDNISSSGQYNPYLLGVNGNLRKTKEFTYLALRKQEKTNGNSNIRVDGTFAQFSPFWYVNGGNDWTNNPSGWTYTNEVTVFSPFGVEQENKDALNRYSAAQYGYFQTKPVAITSNSKFKQMANENFEALGNCVDDHFGFKNYTANSYIPASATRSQKYSHTGRRSIKVAAGGTQTVEITKQLIECQSNASTNAGARLAKPKK
jgi:hypothetical protein